MKKIVILFFSVFFVLGSCEHDFLPTSTVFVYNQADKPVIIEYSWIEQQENGLTGVSGGAAGCKIVVLPNNANVLEKIDLAKEVRYAIASVNTNVKFYRSKYVENQSNELAIPNLTELLTEEDYKHLRNSAYYYTNQEDYKTIPIEFLKKDKIVFVSEEANLKLTYIK